MQNDCVWHPRRKISVQQMHGTGSRKTSPEAVFRTSCLLRNVCRCSWRRRRRPASQASLSQSERLCPTNTIDKHKLSVQYWSRNDLTYTQAGIGLSGTPNMAALLHVDGFSHSVFVTTVIVISNFYRTSCQMQKTSSARSYWLEQFI